MIRPCRTSSPSGSPAGSSEVTGRGGGTRWPARTGGRRGRSGCRRTGSSAARPRAPARRASRRPGPRRRVIRTRNSSSGSGSSKSSSTCSGETTAASVNGNTSITIRSSCGSHDSVMVPARNSSSIGCSSGSASSRPSGATAGMTCSLVPLAITSSSSSSMRSASAATCCFSRATLTTRAPDAGLEEERALAGRADGARDEPLRRVESVDEWSHVAHPRGAPKGSRDRRPRRPRRPPRRAADACGSLGRGRGASQARSPAWVLVAST